MGIKFYAVCFSVTTYTPANRAEEVGHASCHVISLAYARLLDSATFIHQDSLLATFVLWSTYNRHGIVQAIDRTADLKQ